jgi:hypothetical protein
VTVINQSRIWMLESTDSGAEAPELLVLNEGDIATVQMDFRRVMNPDWVLTGTPVFSISSGAAFATAISAAALSGDKFKAEAKVTVAATGETGTRKINVKCSSTNGTLTDTLNGEGWLIVE